MRRLLLSIAMCCLLSACAFGVPPTPDEPIRVPPPANLIAAPQPLQQPRSGRIQDLEANHREVAKAYHQLASQMCGLLAFLQIKNEGCEPWTKSF